MTEIGVLRTKEPIEKAISEIKNWLSFVKVSGLDLIIQYDARINIAVLKFKKNGKDYEFRSTTQANCRLNMWGIARVMEYKVRSHLMKIEDFDKSMSAYLQLENKSDTRAESISKSSSYTELNYVALGISPLSSNIQIQEKYKSLMRSFHPDMALSEEAKKEFEKRASQINQAYAQIKLERGL
jgi:hypothetical protein